MLFRQGAALHAPSHAAAVWDQAAPDGTQAVYRAVSADAGKNRGAARRLSESGLNATYPRVVTGAGRFLVLWTEFGADGKPSLKGCAE